MSNMSKLAVRSFFLRERTFTCFVVLAAKTRKHMHVMTTMMASFLQGTVNSNDRSQVVDAKVELVQQDDR